MQPVLSVIEKEADGNILCCFSRILCKWMSMCSWEIGLVLLVSMGLKGAMRWDQMCVIELGGLSFGRIGR